jgi:hypothetical protein
MLSSLDPSSLLSGRMSSACDSRLNSIRDFSRGKFATESFVHPFHLTTSSNLQSAHTTHPAGLSRLLTNKLPVTFYQSLSCKYDADACRKFVPFSSHSLPPKPRSQEPAESETLSVAKPRPRHQLRVNETASGIRLGGKRQYHAADVRR